MRRCCADDPILLDEALDLLANHADGVDPVDGADPWARQAVVPRSVGPWRVIELVGQGGMGIVYRARRLGGDGDGSSPGPDVALKVLRATLVGGQAERRFQREIEALRRLDHPGIARLLDAGADDDGTPWVATEFVAGSTLTRWRVASGADTTARVRLLAELCEAIQAAHDLGIVHRDLKPGNIFIAATAPGEWRPVLLDFGIALDVAPDAPPPPARIVGTPEYMAPEQILGRPVDPRADIYGFGVLLFRAITGALPFQGATRRDLYRAHLEEPPPRMSDVLGAELPLALEVTVARALAKDPEDRWPSVSDVRLSLARIRLTAPSERTRATTQRLLFPERFSATRTIRRVRPLSSGVELAS